MWTCAAVGHLLCPGPVLMGHTASVAPGSAQPATCQGEDATTIPNPATPQFARAGLILRAALIEQSGSSALSGALGDGEGTPPQAFILSPELDSILRMCEYMERACSAHPQCSPSGSLNPTPLCASSRALIKADRPASPLHSSARSCHKAPAMQELRHSGCAQLPTRGHPTFQVRTATLVCAHSATCQPISAPSLGLVRREALPPSTCREGHSVLPQPPCLYSVLQSALPP